MNLPNNLDEIKVWEIAQIISQDWKNPYFGAVPYLDAMKSLSSIYQDFGFDSGESVIRHFLCNAGTWRGPVARAVKRELNRRLNRRVK